MIGMHDEFQAENNASVDAKKMRCLRISRYSVSSLSIYIIFYSKSVWINLRVKK